MGACGLKAQPAAPIETFARFQAFHRFHGFSLILMVFHGSGVIEFGEAKKQPAAPIKTFARFQAGFLSSEDFHRFLLIIIDFSWIFIDFHGFSWISEHECLQRYTTVSYDLLPL